ncbi:MAG: hypothetical protein R2813_10485 [Flavobacteriales bacterium]
MELLEELVEALLLLIPVAGVVAVVYVMLTKYFESQEQKQLSEWKQKQAKDYLPIQMQAYERLILLMERTHPERLVFRINKPGMSARLMRADIMKLIRDEFDHNLTQQLYISNEAWESVKAAREETLKILNLAAERTDKDGSSMEFSTAILEIVGQMKRTPTDIAIDILKAEFRKKLKG